jgi:CRP/FNR family cyclic AMP-dependent transcriptional regulator
MQLLNAPPAAHRSIQISGGAILPAAIQRSGLHLHPVPATAETATANDPALRDRLAAHPALGTLPEQDRQALLRWSRIRTLKRQEVICRQGDPATTVILVLDGYLKRSASLADGGEVFLDIAGPGECAGETAALDRCAHDADITALSPCRLLMIDARQFWQALERRPEALLTILRLSREQQRRITGQLIGIGGLPAPARLANVLRRLAQLSDPGGEGVSLRLSQAELAVMTGVSRELVNKQLREWRDAGWVTMAGGTVTSIQAAALADVVGEDADRDMATIRKVAPPERTSAALTARRLSH